MLGGELDTFVLLFDFLFLSFKMIDYTYWNKGYISHFLYVETKYRAQKCYEVNMNILKSPQLEQWCQALQHDFLHHI